MLNKYILSTILAAGSLGISAQTQPRQPEYRQGQLIVKFKDGNHVNVKARGGKHVVTTSNPLNMLLNVIKAEEMTPLMPLTGSSVSKAKARDFNGNEVEDNDLSQLYLLEFDKTASVTDVVKTVAELDEVEFAEPNYIVKGDGAETWGKDDPLYSEQWGLEYAKVPELWQATASAPNVLGHRPVIAIIDTGVDITHPDLVSNIWTNANEVEEDGEDNDGNGYKDDLHGWDFVNQTGVIGDYNGHGTHCAGVAAAVGNNSLGVIGANPDALIMPVTVLQSNGMGDVATIIKGVDYAAANGADVISMSIGGYQYSIAYDQALGKAYAKSFIVAASGNDGMPIGMATCFPAAFTYVLGVQATMPNGCLASFSNFDNDGPVFSTFGEEKLYNYEISAPGTSILNTYPGGRYKALQGTSMACPLVAGLVSRILQTKEYNSKEELFGDIIHTSRPLLTPMGGLISKYGGPIDAEAVYNITATDRTPNLQLISVEYTDSLGDCDGRIDAGETVDVYPTIRNDWGQIPDDVTVSLDFADNEDRTLCEFITNDVKLGNGLSGYGKVKFPNPIRIKMRDNIVDGRIVRLVVKMNYEGLSEDYEPMEFTFKVENGVELGGNIREDMTLYPGVQYIVTRNWGIPKDRVVTVKAGTTIKIKDNVGISNWGHMIFEGKPDSMITITKGDNDLGNIGDFMNDNANYVEFNYVIFDNLSNITFDGHRYNNCIIRNCYLTSPHRFFTTNATFRGCEIYNNNLCDPYCNPYFGEGYLSSGSTFIESSIHDNMMNLGFGSTARFYHSNYIGNETLYDCSTPDVRSLEASNCYGNYYDFKFYQNNPSYVPGFYSVVFQTVEPEVFYLANSYLGTASEKVAYKEILDANDNVGWGEVDVWQMLKYADENTPACVDYVTVDGKNPLDDEEDMAPLGVGTHHFEIGFNRAMDQSVLPSVSMGVRPPYVQKSISENGRWYDPYTYKADITIDGKSATDGLNRIRIYGYRQKGLNSQFSAPDEKYRYNVRVSAAGSMSTGMMAEAGLGKVSLTWETDEEDFEDLMGYNIYRFTMDEEGNSSDSMMVNKRIVEKENKEFTDYDVVPGITYYYYIKEIGTDLTENFVSTTVAATPLTAKKGDANGSFKVDIADVMAEIAYLSNEKPEPFIFEAADVNSDGNVDILDVVGTLNIIINPELQSASLEDEEVAYCYEKDGRLFVNSPVALGGIQVLYSDESVKAAAGSSLSAFEQLSVQYDANHSIMLAYSMSGAVLPAGEQEIMVAGENLNVSDIVLSTPRGTNVRVVFEDATGIMDIASGVAASKKGVYDLTGRKLSKLPKSGTYIVNGKKVCVGASKAR